MPSISEVKHFLSTTEAFYIESNLDFCALFVTQDCFVIKMPRYLAVLSFFEKKFITILQNKRKTDLIIWKRNIFLFVRRCLVRKIGSFLSLSIFELKKHQFRQKKYSPIWQVLPIQPGAHEHSKSPYNYNFRKVF